MKRHGQTFFLLLAAAGLFLWVPSAKAIETEAEQVILMDFETGNVLLEKEADKRMAPASMSKLMTTYMVFERLDDGRLSLDDTFTVSVNAWEKGGVKSGSSTMFLDPRTKVTVEDLLRGIIVQSGNDACIAVAENLSGSEEAFAEEMTRRAHEMGLEKSTFANSTGWPDPDHRMTARELALLAEKIIRDFPEYYSIYSEKNFTYNGIKQGNRNPLLYRRTGVRGADGLKTGHTEESGYGLVGSVKRNGRRLVLVINGLNSSSARAREAVKLMEWGFREFDNYPFFKKGEKVLNAEVWLGKKPFVPLMVEEDVVFTLSPRIRRNLKVTAVYDTPVPTPIRKGEKIGTLKFSAPGMETKTYPLVAGKSVLQLGFFGRIFSALEYLAFGNLSAE